MDRTPVALILTGLVIGGGMTIAYFMPSTRPQSSAAPPIAGPPREVRLDAVVRDFHADHPDFQTLPTGGFGFYAGLAGERLDGRAPDYDGPGFRVNTQALDAAGRPIAPHVANRVTPCSVTDFEIVDGYVIPGVPFAARFTVIGAAITSGGADMPVTVQARVGADLIEPFGGFSDPLHGDVNDHANPRHVVLPRVYPAGTRISVKGRSWVDGDAFMTQTSAGSSPYVLVLEDGDEVPDIEPFEDQTAAAAFLVDYIDTASGTVRLEENQAIFLYELGVTDLSSPAADFQDLVVVVTLARSAADLVVDDTIVAVPGTDTPAVMSTTPDRGATSDATFGQWFRDDPGVNLSTAVPITLVRQPDGVYLYDDQLDPRLSTLGGFFPIDDTLFGNEGRTHNHHFTAALFAKFVYDESAGQYVEYTGDADAWAYVDDQLGIDLGGVHGILEQRIDLSRLCLVDGRTYWFRLFFAHRHAPGARLRLETNIVFKPSGVRGLTSQYD